MRLGAYDCVLQEGSKAAEVYKRKEINERHRHRYEYNNAYKDQLTEAGLIASGVNPDTGLVEIVESSTPFLGVQFHPEYKSTVVNPHPLFVGFVKAALLDKSAVN